MTAFLDTTGARAELEKNKLSGPKLSIALDEWLSGEATRQITVDHLIQYDDTRAIGVEVLYSAMQNDIVIAQASFLSKHGIGTDIKHVKANTRKGDALLELAKGLADFVYAPKNIQSCKFF